MGEAVYVYKPVGKIKDYLPYFQLEKDKEIKECQYLIRECEIEVDSPLMEEIVKTIENNYAILMDSEQQKAYENSGMKFEYVLNPDQTNSYKLILDEETKKRVAKCFLNIAIYDNEMEELVIGSESGMCYGNITAFNYLVKKDKELIDTLIKNKLLKKRKIKPQYFPLDDEFDD